MSNAGGKSSLTVEDFTQLCAALEVGLSYVRTYRKEWPEDAPPLTPGAIFDRDIFVISVARSRLFSLCNGQTAAAPIPIPMVLHCPCCGAQHVDKAEPENGWDNPPHRSHLCAACGVIWRPADVPTVGVQAITTRGTKDTPLGEP